MSKKPLSAEELRGQLFQGSFARQGGLPEPGDPTVETPLPNLDITRIKSYEDNPRRERNAAYDELKENIRVDGLKQSLIVTRRPGDELYMVEYGGNTRLQILKELAAETQDPRFTRTNAIFRPWVSESYVLMNHLDENDLRAPLIFIDKAQAYLKLKQKIEAERGTEFSQREYVAYLADNGRKLSQRDLGRMNFAANELNTLILEALRSGLGPWVVDRINRLQSDYSSYWARRFPDRALDEFDHLFQDTLRRNDSFEFDVDVVRDALDEAVSEHCDISLRELRMEIDAMARGIAIDLPPEESDIPTDVVLRPISNVVSSPTLVGNRGAATTPHTGSQLPLGTPAPSQPTNKFAIAPEASSPDRESATMTNRTEDYPATIESLRASNYSVAAKLAQRFDLGECITPARIGLGFLVDLPPRAIQPGDHPQDEIRSWVWWLLISASEQAINLDRLKLLPSGNRMRTLAINGQYPAIEAIVGTTPTMASIYFKVLNDPFVHESEELFHALFALGSNARQMRLLVGDAGTLLLWGGRHE